MVKKKQEPFAGSYIEATVPHGDFVVSIQVRQSAEGFSGTWWVSGPGHKGMIRLLLEIQMQLSGEILEEAMSVAKGMVEPHILRLAKLSSIAGGMRVLAPENDAALRLQLAEKHIHFHKRTEGFYVEGEANAETVQLYFLAKGFGVKSPVNYVAKYLDVPISTITRRLARARDEGLIPKLNAGFQSDKDMIEGYEY
jgi:hypothetical protein